VIVVPDDNAQAKLIPPGILTLVNKTRIK